MRYIKYLTVACLIAAVSGCDLEVTNENNPDRPRMLGNPADIEALAGSQFQQIIFGTIGEIERVHTGMLTAAFENASGLANNGLGPRSGIERQPIDNNRGNAYAVENFNDYRILASVARNSADVLARAKDPEFTLTSGAGAENRLMAWAHFTAGVSVGYLSLVYDSVGVPRPDDDPHETPMLEGYLAANAYALAQFDSALAYATMPGTSDIPEGWLTGPGGPSLDMTRFAQVIRSFRARMRAGVARDPAERAAVDWDQVIADALAGIESDLEIHLDPSKNWDYEWLSTGLHFRDANWHQMTPYIIGMADVSGGFERWLATPRANRTPFLIITPDLRFPQGSTRAAQNADRGGQGVPTGGKYFRNRDPGGDQAATGWQNSQYDHYRFRALSNSNRVGILPFFTKAENDMLAAEGLIRRQRIAEAAELIDRTRTRPTVGLPALSGVITSDTQPVPGGSECVPRVPVGPDFTTTACGNIMEAMKWEKRMETAYTTYGAWFFDARGWGDLPIGTAVHWPVPNQEADARGGAIYNMGGVGQPGGAGPSTYGYGSGDR